MAMLGGAALIALMLITVISVTGRALSPLGLGPAPGDFELVEAGAAFAIAAFMPWCQWRRGHVTVDILFARAGPRLNAQIDVAANLLMTLASTLIAWRMAVGMFERRGSGLYMETTFILQFPVWWGYAGALCGLSVFALVCCRTVARSLREARA